MSKISRRKIFGKVETLISQDTTVKGTIEASGTIRVDGTVKGGIRNTEGVIIGDTGMVEGDIHSKGVNLAGKVKGNVHAESILELLPGSTLVGDIATSQLSIAEGAHFDGVCNMLDESKLAESHSRQVKQETLEEPT
ncbi:MAG: polymer-forming cytoskeletal protein [Elusimicrobia bacterium]|nr:polymer-forming cytoskeletal protein [Elusimicrobiota bacterium]